VTGLVKTYFNHLHQYFLQFVPLSKEAFEKLVPYFVIRELDKKTIIVHPGETDDYFNIIAKGLVRKYMVVNKKEITIQLATEGHMIHSEISFNTRMPSDCFIETIEPSVLISMSYENLQKVYANFPEFEKLGRLVITDMFIRKDIRDMTQLKNSTRERFVTYMKKHPDMLQRVPQKYLASYLNIKPETFSRLKHLLKSR
jgi:CRP-like cAMP-binding protein